MTESFSDDLAPPKPAAPKSSFWEDVIDIFVSPYAVFVRRQNTSVWPPLLFVTIAFAVIGFATFGTLSPIFDAEMKRQMTAAMAKNPQMTAEQFQKGAAIFQNVGKFVIGPIIMISIFLVGVVSWAVGKCFSSTQNFQTGLVVAAWAYMPRLLGSIAGAVQGLLMDPASLTGPLAITLSPARFMDPDTSNQLVMQLSGRLDLTILWETVLLAIGLYATGKVSKNRAIAFGVVIWIVGSLPALRQGLVAM